MRSTPESAARCALAVLACACAAPWVNGQDLGARWGTAEREREYYRVVTLPTPEGEVIEAGGFEVMPDGRIAIGTRRGDIYLVGGVDEDKPDPDYHLYATGLDEIFGLAHKDGALYVTQSCELTRVLDTNGDGRADRFETVSDEWGYENYHEYAFGSKFDPEGNLYVALGLSASYHSRALFRGWVMKVTPDGESIPDRERAAQPGEASGQTSTAQLFYVESQGPWNSSCSLKATRGRGASRGIRSASTGTSSHPTWAPAPGAARVGGPHRDRTRARAGAGAVRRGLSLHPHGALDHRLRGRTGRAAPSAPSRTRSSSADFTLSLIMRATTEKRERRVAGRVLSVPRGAVDRHPRPASSRRAASCCAGGTNRGWPVRGIKPFALERLEWTGRLPFEIERVSITPTGFDVSFTKPLAEKAGSDPRSYAVSTFTHIYHRGYGGPEVDRTSPTVESVQLAPDRTSVSIVLDALKKGHVHEFDLGALRADDGSELLHRHAYYTVNEIPERR